MYKGPKENNMSKDNSIRNAGPLEDITFTLRNSVMEYPQTYILGVLQYIMQTNEYQ
jgi:hypothetical protein